ncbi:MAG TPA: type IV secretion system DNA-binding domain-containing protein [Candidatus Paceibacterota bacterium]|nr:type IV secretion system DNA-binding domain-containing protein [Candidatus Paceibacterota bacterium]
MDNPDRITYFAATDSRGKRVPFGIKSRDRDRHMYVIGKTGMGKSTLLENMAIQDIRNGEGLAFIDPHGSAVDALLEYIPENRIQDVVYFAPFDMENPVAFNVMEDVGYDKRHLVVSGLMATFKKIWVDAWSARMEYILSNTLLALLEYPDATLMGVNRMYTDKAYRKKVVENVKDPLVKDFWVKEFATYTDRYTQEATPAIQNKIGQFTSNPLIRNIIGQPKSSFDIREAMDQKKIILINLSKGLVGDTNMKLLGSMITTRIFLAAMSRADLSAHDIAKLPNFYFYVDEFQNFANETFAEILSEARKYKLNLIIAHQYVEQMEEEVRAAVFGNVGSTVSFRVGPFDAEVLETVFSPEFMKEDIVNLGKTQIYLSLMIDGVGSRPFSAVTIPPIEAPARTFRNEVLESSRRQFATPRETVEGLIFSELAATADIPPEPPAEKKRWDGQKKPAPRRDVPPRAEPAPKRPEPTPKSADDLKAILRSMSEGAKREKQGEEKKHQSGIKTALKEVIQGTELPERPRAKELPAHPRNKELPRSEQRQERRESAPRQEGPQPFEVPEDTLRAIFKDNV